MQTRTRKWYWRRFRVAVASELAMPPSITIEMAKGFSLYMVKAIMNGRTDEVIDLARSNLWR
jgi:pyruvate dehydrogenase (quinone)